MVRAPRVFLVAGEPSGDALGARLMAALKAETGGNITFAGVGGAAMRAEGLDSLFPMDELAVMGFLEVLPRVPRLLRRVRQVVAAVRDEPPDVVVTIDSWGFNGRLARRFRKAVPGVPLVHYVAPMVWAWKAGRARELAGILDHLMVLLPNEPAWFTPHGLPTTCVGHPVLDRSAAGSKDDGAAFRARHDVPADAPLLTVLPGSRRSEVDRLLAPFGGAVADLARRFPGLRVVVPTVETVADRVRAAVAQWAAPAVVTVDPAARAGAFAAADAAIAASGTVVLELAAAGVPVVVGYRVSPVSAWLARRWLTVRYVTLVNLVLDREAIPEYLQEHCRADTLADGAARLLADPEAARAQRAAAGEALGYLGRDGPSPAPRAARVVLDVAGAGGIPDNGNEEGA